MCDKVFNGRKENKQETKRDPRCLKVDNSTEGDGHSAWRTHQPPLQQPRLKLGDADPRPVPHPDALYPHTEHLDGFHLLGGGNAGNLKQVADLDAALQHGPRHHSALPADSETMVHSKESRGTISDRRPVVWNKALAAYGGHEIVQALSGQAGVGTAGLGSHSHNIRGGEFCIGQGGAKAARHFLDESRSFVGGQHVSLVKDNDHPVAGDLTDHQTLRRLGLHA